MNVLHVLAPGHMKEAFLLEDAYAGRAGGTGLKQWIRTQKSYHVWSDVLTWLCVDACLWQLLSDVDAYSKPQQIRWGIIV